MILLNSNRLNNYSNIILREQYLVIFCQNKIRTILSITLSVVNMRHSRQSSKKLMKNRMQLFYLIIQTLDSL